MIEKFYATNKSRIPFPTGMKSGLIIAISLLYEDQKSNHSQRAKMTSDAEQMRYMYLNILPNGKYYIKSAWNEEDEYDMNDILKYMKYSCPLILNQIL